MNTSNNNGEPLVGILMGSQLDWATMSHAARTLVDFGIPYEANVLSAHRTPKKAAEYAETAESRGLKLIIAGAGCAAHLAGVMASLTIIPVLGVPMQSSALNGQDSLYSTIQMPAGIPVPTFAIGKAGAINAALSAVSILALSDPELREKLVAFRQRQGEAVLAQELVLQ